MKVLNIGTSEMEIIKEALDYLGGTYNQMIQEEKDKKLKEELEYKAAHIRTTCKLIEDMSLQELCERCLSYFWDRLSIEGTDNPDVEWLAEDMGLNVEEFIELFHDAGFEEE